MDSSDQFEITIDFVRGEGDPNRVFQTMSGLIEAVRSLDAHLVSSLDISLEVELVLDEVETGSLKAKFRDVIKGVPDEALKEVDWKKVVGHLLLRSKYAILSWLEKRTEIGSIDDVKTLQGDLQSLAEETDIKQLPAYSAPRPEQILTDIRSIQESLGNLREGDSANYGYGKESVGLNPRLEISSEVVQEVLTKEVLRNTGERIIRVKKPDYLGQSMWSFQYEGHAIDATIQDENWLKRFQSREIDVKPGDSIRVSLFEETSYGYEGEIVQRHYEVERVYEVLKPSGSVQTGMDF